MPDREGSKPEDIKNITFTRGQIHGLQAKAFFAAKGLYYALISAWGEKIGKAGSNRYHFDLRGYQGQFYSKGSGLKHEGRPLFEYVIELKNGHKKLFLTFSPRLAGMEFRKGEEWNLNKRQGEGVECSIQSSYHSPEKIKNLIKDVFWSLELERFFIAWDLNETYLISFENYIRYHEKKEQEVVNVIKEILQLIGLSETYKLSYSVDKEREGYKFAKLTSDKWYLLGFERGPYFFFVKSYRGKEYPNIKDPVLRHPKLEIGLDVKYNKNNRPKWSEWPKILTYMELVRNSIAIQSGLTIEDLIGDDYFNVQPEEVEIINPLDLKKLEAYYLDRVKEICPVALNDNTKRKFLKVLDQKISVDTAELQKALGLSRQQIFNLISYFEESGIIARFRSNRTFIEFTNPLIAHIMEGKLKLIDNLAPIDERKVNTTQQHKITIDKASAGEGGVFRLLYEASSKDTVNINKKELLKDYLAKKVAFTGVT